MLFNEFKAKFNINLNTQQEAAVRQVNGPTLLLAVPGSGKTTVIITRLGYMVYCQGIDPRSILTMTYTVSATNDMRNRFALLFGSGFADALEFRTINSVCVMIIKHYEKTKRRTAFNLITDAEATKVLRDIYRSLTSEYPTDNDIKAIKTSIAYCKNMLLDSDEIARIQLEGVDFHIIYNAYLKYMELNKLMDFDDQLVYARLILKTHQDILKFFQDQYVYINVDEAQDTSKIQHTIIQMLASRSHNLFMVGDEDQSIYGFRAAYPEALLSFDKIYPEAKVLLMEHNYRSTKCIVERANTFIKQNKSRHDKNMTTSNEFGEPIKHTSLSDCNRQYNYLGKIAKNSTIETAVLYRNNDSAIPIIDMFDKMGIPYQSRQVEGLFFSHYIVKDITDIIRFAFDQSNRDLFQNLYYKFSCGLKKETAAAALKHHKKSFKKPVLEVLLTDYTLEPWVRGKVKALQTHLHNIRDGTSFSAVNRIVNFMGYGEYLKSRHADTSRINILLALANQNPGLNDYLNRIVELNDIINAGPKSGSTKFILSTIHSSKGLEYEKVILIDVVDGLFPRITEPKPGEIMTEEDLAALEEERRLFYVGITRAKRQLEIISYENVYGKPGTPVSSFIKNLLTPKPLTAASAKRKNSTQHTTSQKSHIVSSSTISMPDINVLSKGYIPDTVITHKVFGQGVIIKKEETVVTIRFVSGVTKKFDIVSCIQKKIISLKK